MLGAELIQGCGGPTEVPEVDGNKETKGEGRQSRSKLLEVIRAPFPRLAGHHRKTTGVFLGKSLQSK